MHWSVYLITRKKSVWNILSLIAIFQNIWINLNGILAIFGNWFKSQQNNEPLEIRPTFCCFNLIKPLFHTHHEEIWFWLPFNVSCSQWLQQSLLPTGDEPLKLRYQNMIRTRSLFEGAISAVKNTVSWPNVVLGHNKWWKLIQAAHNYIIDNILRPQIIMDH